MERVPFSAWHTRARIVMGSATFFDAYNALSLAFALPILIRLWHITPTQSGFLIGISYVGQLAGALLFGWLAEKYGRVRSASAAVAIMSVMSLACALAGNFPELFVCRLIQGVGVGGEMPVAAAYINELSRAQGRGRFFLLYEMIFPVGLLAAGQIGAWLVPMLGWKIVFFIGGVPGLLVTWLVSRLPESPRWLISQGRTKEAEIIVREVEASATQALSEIEQPSLIAIEAAVAPRHGKWSEALARSYRGRTLTVWMLWACAFFVANSLNNWMPSLYNTVYRLGLQDSLRAASLTNIAQVLLLLVCALCIDRVGRRNWSIASFFATGVLLTILGIARTPRVLVVVILATASYGVVGTVNAVLYLYTPEIYPTRMRAIGTGLATAWLRLASAVGPPIVGAMVQGAGVNVVFLMFAGVGMAGALASIHMVETRGRSLEEIAL
jgi:putative MFS transporter